MAKIKRVKAPFCLKCGIPFHSKKTVNHICARCLRHPPKLDRARSIFIYQGPVAQLIKGFKYRGDLSCLRTITKLSRPLLQEIFSDMDIELKAASNRLCIVPVPLHTKRLRMRTFNQSAIIAKRLFVNMAIKTNLVERTVNNPPQSDLAMKQRMKNVKGIFKVESLHGYKDFLIVDDVMTTGSTLEEIAKVLKQKGASRVFALTIARAV